ncbi:MAG: CPBP family intramembrane metalloprotease [Bacteroidales bacterium]|nr:CPBP family intramembrane metalloprotease [Bacteroidales bacterium]
MYLKQAYKGYTDFWRYLIILLLVFVLNIISSIPFSIAAAAKALINGSNIQDFAANMDPTTLGFTENQGLLLLITPLALVFIGLTMGMKYIHGVSWRQVYTSASRFRWKNFFFAVVFWLLLLVAFEYIYFIKHPESYSFHFAGNQFWIMLIISLLSFPLQASWEELYFRGNLMQGIGVLTGTRYIPLILTSVLFGLMHILNPEVDEFGTGIAMAQYMGFGLLLGITVVMDGGLEMAFGMHTINNIYAACFVSYKGSVLHTPSLFSSSDVDLKFMTISFYLGAALFLVVTKYVFKWESFTWIFKPLRRSEA